MTQYKENVCPQCRADTSNLALQELLMVWEPCNCDDHPYTHLVEVHWHRVCFIVHIAELALKINNKASVGLDSTVTMIEEHICQK